MNRGIFKVVFGVLLGIFVQCSTPRSEKEPEQIQALVNDLPQMTIVSLEGSEINVKELEGKKVLIFFQPDCDHCQREAVEIQENLEAFKNTNLYFITSQTLEEAKNFANTYGLSDQPNITFARTSTESVLKNYGPIATPSIYIYTENNVLIKAFNGEVKIETVLKYI